MNKISLEQIAIPTPCPANWNDMRGNQVARFCQHCQKTVHDLSAMTRSEAERLVCESGGDLCAQFTRLRDGQILTLDYRAAQAKRWLGWRAWSLTGLSGALVAGVIHAALFGSRVMPWGTQVRGGVRCVPTGNNSTGQSANGSAEESTDGPIPE